MGSVSDCHVMSMRRVDGAGSLKAFADLRIGGAVIVRGCAIFDGKNGVFAKLPQQVSRDGRWYEVVIACDDTVKKAYQEALKKAYADRLADETGQMSLDESRG